MRQYLRDGIISGDEQRAYLLKSRAQGEIFQDADTASFASKDRPHSDPNVFAYDPATVAI